MNAMGGYGGSHNRACSETSELAWGESSEVSADEGETTSIVDYHGRECSSAEWTDEKHSLYLKSMEASFVDQLNNSLGFLVSRSEISLSNVEASMQMYHAGTGTPSSLVLCGGFWKRMNFRRHESHPNRRDSSYEFLTSPWVKHDRTVSKNSGLMSPSLEESYASESEKISSVEKNGKWIQIGCSMRGQDIVGCGEEESDQNFIDEEIKGEKASSLKKMKVAREESLSNDRVKFSSR